MPPKTRRRSNANGPSSRRLHRQHSISPLSDRGECNDTERSRRQRAPIACRVCRTRKVKCSNTRPTCAGCERLGCECVYPESVQYGLDSSGRGNAQLGSLLQDILQRLPSAPAARIDPEIAPLSALRIHSEEVIPMPMPASDSGLGISPGFTSLEHVFQWPIFHSPGVKHVKNFLLAAEYLGTQNSPYVAVAPGASITFLDGDEIMMLLRRFLRLVHVMNPVLDCTALLSYGRQVIELGLQWDVKTCLVLVAAALGAIAKSLIPVPDTAGSLLTSDEEDSRAYRQAESYYAHARRRFGLLDRSFTACQCRFLSGIYLLYTLRPLQAWQSFFEASSIYTVYLKGQAAAQGGNRDEHPNHDPQCQLEQRLYWSCIKSESEICAEVEMARSDLYTIDCSYEFPSPPASSSIEVSCANDRHANSASSSTAATLTTSGSSENRVDEDQHETSWFYYLSEISLLRLSSRVNNIFYTGSHSTWTRMNLLDMLNVGWDFDKQLQQWQAVLPTAISCFNVGLDFTNVTGLQLATWSRCASIKLRLYRPFLFRLASRQLQDWVLEDSLRQFAEKAVWVSLDPLHTLGLRHRHAGTWYKCRETAVRALIILYARNIGLLERMGVGQRAEVMLDICIGHLRYWEGEANDLRLVRQVLDIISFSEKFRQQREQ